MDAPDHSFSPESTRGLFRALAVFTVVVPAVIAGAVCAVLYLRGIPIERKQIKLICFVTWLGTMAALIAFAYLRRKGSRFRHVRASPLAINESTSPGQKWEQRNARRLSVRLYAFTIVVPILGISLAAAVLKLMGHSVGRYDVLTMAMAGWTSGILIAVIYGLRSRRSILGG